MKKVLPAALAASITVEAALSVRHSDMLEPQPKSHIELNVTPPSEVLGLEVVPASGGAGGFPTSFVINQIS
jgi:hypothetical protein